MASYGVTCNISYTNNDGVMECGAHLTDSEGMDISVENKSDNAQDLFDLTCADLAASIDEHILKTGIGSVDKEADEIQRLKDENARLTEQIKQLQNKTKENESPKPEFKPDKNTRCDSKSKKKVDIKELTLQIDDILANIEKIYPNFYDIDSKLRLATKEDSFDKSVKKHLKEYDKWAKNIISTNKGYWNTVTHKYE